MKQTLKEVLEKEIRLHTQEQKKHYKLAQARGSNNEKRKHIKHQHKRFQTVKIANALGFEVCECCGGLKWRNSKSTNLM